MKQQGFLGAAPASVGIAVSSSISGSGLPSPNLPVPKISAPKVSASKSAAPKAVMGSPKSFIKAPKGEICC